MCELTDEVIDKLLDVRFADTKNQPKDWRFWPPETIALIREREYRTAAALLEMVRAEKDGQ